MIKASFFQRLLSYIYPVRIRKSSSRHNPLLELFLYRGQYQLSTEEAYYSDGNRYRPLVLAFNHIGDTGLAKINSVLVLGAGLGSAVQILMNKGFHPQYTLVDNDEKILSWLKEVMRDTGEKINCIFADAGNYMDGNAALFGMVVVDVFKDRTVPAFVTTQHFLQQCRRAIAPGGIFIMNYIVNDEANWQSLLQNIHSIFPNSKICELEVNRVIIASV